jgi:adenylate cyclase
MSDAPENPKSSRRLAAILAADIAGYSALMGADEEATVRDLKAHQAVVLPMIADHGGRVIDTAGDGILAEFASVLGAVKCALAIQKTMSQRNEAVDPTIRMQFRIGINQGDVVVDDARVYGDGVNIAARPEAIADPSGICISEKVYQEVRGRIVLPYEDLGPQQLKNISEPVHVYRVRTQGTTSGALQTRPALALPDKPSVAVLPFINMSGDPTQDYFTDGITEDVITELSRFSELFVIARNSSFQYKGKSPEIRRVGRELGVQYVLEGSIRRSGDRVRITAQLIDASTAAHRWAERYDRKLEDVFAVQDEIAQTIGAILAAHVNKAEAERVLLKPPATWHAYDYHLRATEAYSNFWLLFKAEGLYEVRQLLQRSLSVDPNYARAYVTLSHTFVTAYIHKFDGDHLNPTALERAYQLAQNGVRLDPQLPIAQVTLAWLRTYKREYDAALAGMQKASSLNPNFLDWRYGQILIVTGEPERAVDKLLDNMRLDPFYSPLTSFWLAAAYYLLRRYSDALPLLIDSAARAPNWRAARIWLAATYGQLNRPGEARAQAAEARRISPNLNVMALVGYLLPLKRNGDLENYLEGVRKAGLLE